MKFDANMMTYLGHPYCPAIIGKAYGMLKGVLSGMVDA